MAEKPAIIVKDIKKSFKDVPVLKGVSFTVEKGSVIALLGSNGAGKTTTINILTTLLSADDGTATVNGFNVAKHADDVRKQIGLTGQFAAVDDMLTGRENLIMFAKLWHLPRPKKIAADLLATFNLEEAADRAAMTYSGGMRRRLDIAMSLIGTPPIIFLDEPTTGLDPQSRNAMWDIIRDMTKRGVTIFLTTQYLDEADQLADTIAILHEGRIVTQGTPSQLKRHITERHMELKFSTETLRHAAKKLLQPYNVTENAAENTITVTTNGSAAEAMTILQTLQKQNIAVVFAGQTLGSLLRDIAAGATMIIEKWFNIGDYVKVEPFPDVAGVVERLTLRSTKIRNINGEVIWIHNQQIMAVHVTPRGVRIMAVDIFVRDREKGEKEITRIINTVPTGPTLLARPLEIKTAERWGDGLWRITVVGETPPGREWLIENYFVNALKEIDDEDKKRHERLIVHEPIARYADPAADRKFKRAVRLKKEQRSSGK